MELDLDEIELHNGWYYVTGGKCQMTLLFSACASVMRNNSAL
jgi:hypothetical protein